MLRLLGSLLLVALIGWAVHHVNHLPLVIKEGRGKHERAQTIQ